MVIDCQFDLCFKWKDDSASLIPNRDLFLNTNYMPQNKEWCCSRENGTSQNIMMTSSNGHIMTRSFDVFFDLRLNKRLNKQSWGWWFVTQSHSLWRRCNINLCLKWDDDPASLIRSRHLISNTKYAGERGMVLYPIWGSWVNPVTMARIKTKREWYAILIEFSSPLTGLRVYFLVTGDSGGYRYGNLRCHHWRQSWPHDDSHFSALTGAIRLYCFLQINQVYQWQYYFIGNKIASPRICLWNMKQHLIYICVYLTQLIMLLIRSKIAKNTRNESYFITVSLLSFPLKVPFHVRI